MVKKGKKYKSSEEKVDRLEKEIAYYEGLAAQGGKNPPNLDGVTYHPHLARTYPEKMLASNILGFVSREGVGYFGVEQYYNSLLSGKARTISVPLDPIEAGDEPKNPEGASLVLTIDRAVQAAMEEAQTKLRDGSAEWHSYDEVFGD